MEAQTQNYQIFSVFSFNVFKSEYIHRSIFPKHSTDTEVEYQRFVDLNADHCFSFSRFCNLSPQEIEDIFHCGTFEILKSFSRFKKSLQKLYNTQLWRNTVPTSGLLLLPTVDIDRINYSTLEHLTFTYRVKHQNFEIKYPPYHLFHSSLFKVSKHPVYTFTEHVIDSMAETMEHRIIRSKHHTNQTPIKQEALIDEIQEIKSSPVKTRNISILHEHYHIPRPPRHLHCQPTILPRFLYGFTTSKVQCNKRKL